MDLRDATNYLLRTPDVGEWLKLADAHMQAYNKMKSKFVLPADHAVLRPVIEAFAADTPAFVEYVKALRDASDGVAHTELHQLYRTISVRTLQATRRVRIRNAVNLLTPKLEAALGRELTYQDKVRVGSFVEQCWGEWRMAAQEEERRSLRAKRINTEDRSALLDAFWRDIETALAAGKVPLGDKTEADIIEMIKP